jgi:hypothetical protein
VSAYKKELFQSIDRYLYKMESGVGAVEICVCDFVETRLRIKQALPSKPGREQLHWIGSQPAAEVATPTPWSIYSEQLKPNRPDMLFKSLHEVVFMEKDTVWAELAPPRGDGCRAQYVIGF